MQSFWVPALGGQKYTMGKMQTQLYLVADHPGSYLGRNTNFNGRGYADMEFEVLAQTQEDFDQWVKDVANTAPKLTEEKYEELLRPTHLGRLTFSNTHLEWVNHAEPDSLTYTHPELYRYHGYQGKVFEEEDNYQNKGKGNAGNIDNTGNKGNPGNKETSPVEQKEQSNTDGGGHHGH